jgi:hypothetical protein
VSVLPVAMLLWASPAGARKRGKVVKDAGILPDRASGRGAL